jgi:GT2 family glycosyltransferase
MHSAIDKTYPLVSIIILNYNGWLNTKECLESIFRICYPNYEVIVVDNGSTDGSLRYMETYFSNVKVISLPRNYGFADGNNKGATAARGELLVFLNNDTVVEKDWLMELVSQIQKDRQIAVCGSKVVFYSDSKIIDFAGGLISPIGAGINVGFSELDQSKFNTVRYSSHAYGASMLIRKDVFQKIGGFDSDYFIYHEELDLCWRCWLMGWKVLYVPASVIKHKRSITVISEGNWLKLYHAQKNQIRNMIKNFSFFNLVKGLIVNFCFDIYRTSIFFYKRNFVNLKAIWKANLDVVKELPIIFKKRKFIQSHRVLSDFQLSQLKLIASLGKSLQIVFRRRGGFYEI